MDRASEFHACMWRCRDIKWIVLTCTGVRVGRVFEVEIWVDGWTALERVLYLACALITSRDRRADWHPHRASEGGACRQNCQRVGSDPRSIAPGASREMTTGLRARLTSARAS
eukprot:3577414-Pyramimonas_sp.AAC.1